MEPGQGFWLFNACLWLEMEAVYCMYGLKLKSILSEQSRAKESLFLPWLRIEMPPPTVLGISTEKDYFIKILEQNNHLEVRNSKFTTRK